MIGLARRREMLSQGIITFHGEPLRIQNIGNDTAYISLSTTTNLILYYKIDGDKYYQELDCSSIELPASKTLCLFGDNSVINSTFVVEGNTYLHIGGKLESLVTGVSHKKQFGNYVFQNLFKNVKQLISVGADIMPQIIAGVNAPPKWSSGYRYAGLFEGTNIVEIPENFLKETIIQLPHLGLYQRMFANCKSLTRIPKNLFIKQSESTGGENYIYKSMFEGCENLLNAADIYLLSQSFMSADGTYKGCAKIENVVVYTNIMSSNHCMQYFVSGCTSLKSIEIKATRNVDWGIYRYAMKNCPRLEEVHVHFMSWKPEKNESEEITTGWMQNVPSTGTFYCPQALIDETPHHVDEDGNIISDGYANTIPAGWTIIANDNETTE